MSSPNTEPSGLDGEFTTSARVRSVMLASSASRSGSKPCCGSSRYGTGVAPRMCAFIVKVVYPGSGTSTSSPGLRTRVIAWNRACVAPIVIQTCSRSTSIRFSRRSFSWIAARSGAIPPFGV